MTEPNSANIQVSQEQTQKLEQLVDSSTAVLFQTKTVFPFRFFPCEVVLTRSKLSSIDHFFFFSSEMRSILVKEIARIEVEESGFLAAVLVYDRTPNGVAMKVTHLRKQDAHQLRHFIEGLLIADKQGIDVTQIKDTDVVDNVETLGGTTANSHTVKTE